MSTEWLTAQSFHHGQDLLAAINTLSIETKLELAGRRRPQRARVAQESAAVIAAFLDQLQTMIRGSALTGSPITGLDSRRREFAERFLEAKRRERQNPSPFFQGNLAEVKRLLTSPERGDELLLIRCLAELRAIVEKHVHQDALRILGEL